MWLITWHSKLTFKTVMILAVLICILLVSPRPVHSAADELRLYTKLMEGYNVLERPVANPGDTMNVSIGLVLQQIVNLDERNQVFEINAWMKLSWTDHKLKWNPNNYGNITDVRFPSGHIWRPDILVYNSADEKFDSTYHCNHQVYSDGTILWVPPAIFRINCNIDIAWFPFDDQKCFIKFGSWTYHGYAMDLIPDDKTGGVDTSEYLANGEWNLMASPVERTERFYDCCPEPYVDVKFYLHLRRRTLYYMFNLVLPSMLIAVMTLLGFTLPPEAGEKITLEITILLSVYIYMSIFASMTPHTSEAVPLLGIFFTSCMLAVAMSVVMTVMVLNLHYRTPDTHTMNKWVKIVLLNWVPWLLMMTRPGQKIQRPRFTAAFTSERKRSQTESKSLLRNIKKMENGSAIKGIKLGPNADELSNSRRSSSNSFVYTATGNGRIGEKIACNGISKVPPFHAAAAILNNANRDPLGRRMTATALVADHQRETETLEKSAAECMDSIARNPESIDPGIRALIALMHNIQSDLNFMIKRMEKEDLSEDEISDWKYAAMVVDRFCLIFFTIFILGSTVIILSSAPHIFA